MSALWRLTAAGGGALALVEGEDVLCWDRAGRGKANKRDWEEGCELHLGWMRLVLRRGDERVKASG